MVRKHCSIHIILCYLVIVRQNMSKNHDDLLKLYSFTGQADTV